MAHFGSWIPLAAFSMIVSAVLWIVGSCIDG
jgi:hypothetical protein